MTHKLTTQQQSTVRVLAFAGMKPGKIAIETGLSRDHIRLFLAAEGLWSGKVRQKKQAREASLPFEFFSWEKHGKDFGYTPNDNRVVASPLPIKFFKGFQIKHHA